MRSIVGATVAAYVILASCSDTQLSPKQEARSEFRESMDRNHFVLFVDHSTSARFDHIAEVDYGLEVKHYHLQTISQVDKELMRLMDSVLTAKWGDKGEVESLIESNSGSLDEIYPNYLTQNGDVINIPSPNAPQMWVKQEYFIVERSTCKIRKPESALIVARVNKLGHMDVLRTLRGVPVELEHDLERLLSEEIMFTPAKVLVSGGDTVLHPVNAVIHLRVDFKPCPDLDIPRMNAGDHPDTNPLKVLSHPGD